MSPEVYCDAKWFDGIASIAVVELPSRESYALLITAQNINVAECDAIRLAKLLFPALRVFSDCQPACAKAGAIWIPREQNTVAHRLAALAWLQKPLLVECTLPLFPPKRRDPKKTKRHKACRHGGRGVLRSGEISRFVLWDRGD